MNNTNAPLPSNRKFGCFFTAVFWLAAVYSIHVGSAHLFYVFSAIGGCLFAVTLIRPDQLLPLNKLWMGLGQLIGKVVNPIVMAVIFFGVFTPVALIARVCGRDELRLRFKRQATHWVRREKQAEFSSFKNQF